MSLVDSLIERYFGVSNGALVIGGSPANRLAAEYDTPLFVYDRCVINKKLDLLRTTLPGRFSIYYSVKANPNPAILRHFLARDCGLEIASGGELHLALHAGCTPDRMVFAGPGKTEAELEFAIRHEIREIHVESLLEAERIARICRRLRKRARVALRINPVGEAQGGAMRMGGKPAPFGIDEEGLDSTVDSILAYSMLDLRGIHLFAGTQILDHELLLRQYRKGLELGRRTAARIGQPLHTIDFGGGLGIPYFPGEAYLEMDKLKVGLTALFENFASGEALGAREFLVEPGRYLVGEAGVLVCRVHDIKISRGKTFLIVDGGMNNHLAASGNLGQVIKRNFPIALLDRLGEQATETVDIVGPLCTPLDTLGRDVRLPKARVGDLVGIFQSGAYARSASPLGFLSHPTPAEVLVFEGSASLIRRRGKDSDLFADLPDELRRAQNA
jgi:diaminopimelate decarboxylase